jgi:hypothetical protein
MQENWRNGLGVGGWGVGLCPSRFEPAITKSSSASMKPNKSSVIGAVKTVWPRPGKRADGPSQKGTWFPLSTFPLLL